jgi:hypothetical protein
MFELKQLSKDAIATVLAKAERYRLLNEPWLCSVPRPSIVLVEIGGGAGILPREHEGFRPWGEEDVIGTGVAGLVEWTV